MQEVCVIDVFFISLGCLKESNRMLIERKLSRAGSNCIKISKFVLYSEMCMILKFWETDPTAFSNYGRKASFL